MPNFLRKIIKFDKSLDRQTPILLLLALILLLRLPNLFEPYWYGDEGIYLTIGQSLNKGAKLYTEIIDHKTPLIYYLARVQTQLNFRLLNIAWMMVTTTAFYYFAKKLLKTVKLTSFASLIFVLLTTLPWLEGNIPNGELFVLGFVMVGAIILSKTNYFKKFIGEEENNKSNLTNFLLLLSSGILFGLGILTKVPAVLDLAVFFSIGYFTFTNKIFSQKILTNIETLGAKSLEILAILMGTLIPIIISIIYFVAIGSGRDYLDFGLLYNFRYASSWQLPFSSELLQFAFTLQGKFLIVLVLVLFLTFLKKFFKPATQLIITWFGLSLFASLLSNRPYPHYFVQLVPPLALVFTLILRNKLIFIRSLLSKESKITFENILNLSLQTIVILVFAAVMVLLNFAPYSTTKYYKNWFKLITNQITKEEYRQTFDYLMTDNYKAAEIIRAQGEESLFIWGTNPMLYALSETQPTGRFTVSFHIKDFDAFDETARDVKKKKPMFIVVMNNEDYEFSEFNGFLKANYIENDTQFDHFSLWKRNYANTSN